MTIHIDAEWAKVAAALVFLALPPVLIILQTVWLAYRGGK